MALRDSNGSDTSSAGSPAPSEHSQSKNGDSDKGKSKKSANSASADASGSQKITKRRAARACVSCRARKVRCDVVEGAPCGNCRWDNVECVVQESRRRKKHLVTASMGTQQSPQLQLQTHSKPLAEAQLLRSKSTTTNMNSSNNNGGAAPQHPVPISSAAELRRPSHGSAISSTDVDATSSAAATASVVGQMSASSLDNHVPHLLYQRSGYRRDSTVLSKGLSPGSEATPKPHQQQQQQWTEGFGDSSKHGHVFGYLHTTRFLNSLEEPDANAQLPAFVRPLPSKIAAEDIDYLFVKGALTLPGIALQNALLTAYVEYVHPYMPLMDLHEFLNIVNRRDGVNGQTSLFLYQAVMFSATAFVDMKYLREAGYPTRKAARKAFFLKTRLLYDFDYELDRLVLVQALLLMTYWYETPDDQKDTWHWMGVAISLAHTIGLHRDPGSTTMTLAKQKLWKRIWWSCFMRDRLIALGMRRPTRIKDEDFDVPMLEEDDFEIQRLADNITVISSDCALMRDLTMQKELAVMCVAKARLCICISHMLKAQYSVLIRDTMKPENTTNSTMMLFPNKQMDNFDSVNAVDVELMAWASSLPECCQYRPLTARDVEHGRSTVAVQRTLLHMVHYTTISALHRPQFLPSSPSHTPTTSLQVQEMSRIRVREAAMRITRMAAELHQFRLESFLPTTGVTVILPAMIIHLLEMKNPVPQARERATRGFRQCMRVMEKLREVYAAADYATGFLDAALRKAAIDINSNVTPSTLAMMRRAPVEFSAQTPPPENVPYMTPSETLFSEKQHLESKGAMLPPSANVNGNLKATTNPNALSSAIGGATDVEVPGATSPPHTDFGGTMTPSASGGSDEVHVEMDAMDLDFMQGHDQFDWNAVAGTDFDVDQWLQFPSEAADNMMTGFGGSEDVTMSAGQVIA